MSTLISLYISTSASSGLLSHRPRPSHWCGRPHCSTSRPPASYHPSGPHVRANVRSAFSAAGLENHFASHVSSSRLTITLVPDLLTPCAFGEALDGATHVAHIASPLIIGVDDVENDLVRPAIAGTTATLSATLKVSTVRIRGLATHTLTATGIRSPQQKL
jgi:hypothetical protein